MLLFPGAFSPGSGGFAVTFNSTAVGSLNLSSVLASAACPPGLGTYETGSSELAASGSDLGITAHTAGQSKSVVFKKKKKMSFSTDDLLFRLLQLLFGNNVFIDI